MHVCIRVCVSVCVLRTLNMTSTLLELRKCPTEALSIVETVFSASLELSSNLMNLKYEKGVDLCIFSVPGVVNSILLTLAQVGGGLLFLRTSH